MKYKDTVDVFLGALACVLLALSFQLACLPSKNGIFLSLYSLQKITLIFICGVSSLFLIIIKDQLIFYISAKFSSSQPINRDSKCHYTHKKHIFYVFLFSIGTYLLSFNFKTTIKGDFVIQYFAYSQYQQDISSAIDNQKFVTIQK